MRPGIHPTYAPVVFRDKSAGVAFLTRSTATPRATIEWEDGETYPVVDVEVSSASHPFWTGKARELDTEGRVERFRRRYAQAAPAQSAPVQPAPAQSAPVQPAPTETPQPTSRRGAT